MLMALPKPKSSTRRAHTIQRGGDRYPYSCTLGVSSTGCGTKGKGIQLRVPSGPLRVFIGGTVGAAKSNQSAGILSMDIVLTGLLFNYTY